MHQITLKNFAKLFEHLAAGQAIADETDDDSGGLFDLLHPGGTAASSNSPRARRGTYAANSNSCSSST